MNNKGSEHNDLGFIAARQLISEKNWRMALDELQDIDDPKAREWEYKINKKIKIENDKHARRLMLFAVTGTTVMTLVVVFVALLIVINSQRELTATNESSTQNTFVIVTPTPKFSDRDIDSICTASLQDMDYSEAEYPIHYDACVERFKHG